MNNSFKIFCSVILFAWANIAMAQNALTIDISNNNFPIISNHLQLGSNTNAKGESIDANSMHFIKNGKPWFPVMGEFHFSRFPKQDWEQSILKMKACGINIIATYVFWIYHEEEKNNWNWSDNRDLKYFTQLCAKHGMYLLVRIGPWCHGEVRNGGYPDWLLKEAKIRSNDSAYLSFVKLFFQQIANQLKGLYFKDGGTIIGVQIENEFRFNNSKGLTHILTLKKIAVDAGINVPYYTATGWPGSDVKQTELIPVWGGYPEAPWDKRTTQLPLSENYLFSAIKNDGTIGNDLASSQKDSGGIKQYQFPYATAEMGAGIQVTYHRRPIILPQDVLGLAIAKTGAGANLMGYYMFHGGTNAIGKFSSLQESKATKYPNDYPIINYDFQSPIGQWGDIKPCYNYFKLFHSFLNNYGQQLATYHTYFPDNKVKDKADSTGLRWAIRAKDGIGFIFINQFQRQLNMHNVKDVQFNIKTKQGTELLIPEKPITIPANTQFVLPFNLKMEQANLVYATAQPFYIHGTKNATYFFYANDNIAPEFVFDKKKILAVKAEQGVVNKRQLTYKISFNKAGFNAVIELQFAGGKSIKIITLTHEQALNSWSFMLNNKQQFIVSNAQLISKNDSIILQSTAQPSISFSLFNNQKKINFGTITVGKIVKKNLFTTYQLEFKPVVHKITWHLNEQLTNTAKNVNIDTSKSKFYPLYNTRLNIVSAAAYYNISIPQNIKNGFLDIAYEGDTQAIYLNDNLVADDFNIGLPFTVSLQQIRLNNNSKTITSVITPFTKDSKIYFENGIFNTIKNNNLPAIKYIHFKPQYQTIIGGF